jgi:hypothetical protein
MVLSFYIKLGRDLTADRDMTIGKKGVLNRVVLYVLGAHTDIHQSRQVENEIIECIVIA